MSWMSMDTRLNNIVLFNKEVNNNGNTKEPNKGVSNTIA